MTVNCGGLSIVSLNTVDRIVGCALVFICGIAIYAALGMRGGAGVFPIVIGVLCILSCLALLIQSYIERAVEDEAVDSLNWSRFGMWGLCIVVLLTTFDTLGAFVVLPVFLFVSFLLLSHLSWRMSAVISVSFTAAIFVIFAVLLDVPMPAGLLS